MINSKKIRILVLGLILLYSLSFNVFAEEGTDLNGIGVEESITVVDTEKEMVEEDNQEGSERQPVEKNQSGITLPNLPATSEEEKVKSGNTAKAIGEMFSEVGPDAEAVNEANEFLRPFAVIMNKLMAIILGITSLLMMLVTVLDLLYMAFPPVRDMLDGGTTGGQQRMSRNRGMYGMRGQLGIPGGAMMGMDGGIGMQQVPQRQQQIPGGGLSAIGRWVSDEAIAACLESQGGPMGVVQYGPSTGPVKSMIFSYMKKRSMFLMLFGICVILFTSTVFTDLGVKIGIYILRVIVGFGN